MQRRTLNEASCQMFLVGSPAAQVELASLSVETLDVKGNTMHDKNL